MHICPTCGQPAPRTPLKIDLNTGWATSGDWRIHLPPREAELLFALLERAPEYSSIQHLASRLYGLAGPENPNGAFSTFMKRLRRKLALGGYEIKNEYGYGYALRPMALERSLNG